MEQEMSARPKPRITPEEYLDLERTAEGRSEYLAGEMFLMSGGTREHTQIATNISAEITFFFKDKPCVIYPFNMRTKVAQTGLYTYPDIVAVCGEAAFEDENLDTLVNPTLIIEVLSESTESYDRGRKFAHYRSIKSLREYVLVSQWECWVERFLRREDGSWAYSECTDPGGSLELTSIACAIPLSTVYHKVDFERVKRRLAEPKES